MARLTKYVSVTFTGGSNDGSTTNPYTTIEDAVDDINGTTDVGPHYIILSESSAATTTYSASYGLPADSEVDPWIGSYNYGLIISGAHGQDIIIDGKGVTNKNAFLLYGSGSGVHNVTITGYGTHTTAGRGVIRGHYRPVDVRGVTIRGNSQSGITFFGDRYSQGGISIIDSCRVELSAQNNIWGIAAYSNFAIGHVIVNNCLVIVSGSATATPTKAIYIYNGSTSQSTASFNTVVAKFDETSHTDSGFGIKADRAENNIVSMSMPDDASRHSFISADVATNNLYAGFNSTNASTVGARRLSNDTSASFHSTELRYKRDSAALTLFNSPDTAFQSIYADWTLAAGTPAADAGTALRYLDLTDLDLSGSSRADPPDIGAFELTTVTGYTNIIIGVAAGSLGKVIGVTKANTSKVIGT